MRDENTSNGAGTDLYALWAANGRAAPVAMVRDTTTLGPIDVGEPGGVGPAAQLRVATNPFRRALALRLDLRTAEEVELRVFDIRGRVVSRTAYGVLGGGANQLGWDGLDQSQRDAGPGVYFLQVRAGEELIARRVVRLE